MLPDPLRPFNALRLTTLALAVAAVLGACGDGESIPAAGDLTSDERAYLENVLSALRLFDERNEEFGRVLGQVYRTNEALFRALREAGAGTAFEPGLEALTALRPPPRFVDDHEILLERQRSLVLLDRDIGIAIADANLERFVLLNMRLELTSTRGAIELEPIACETVLRNGFADHDTQPAEYLAKVFCDQSELPGNGYGDRVREILRGTTIEVAGRGGALAFFGLVPVVSDEAFLEVANEAFTEIVEVTKTASRQIQALEPPERMTADHEHLLRYLDQVESIMDDLVGAALAGDRKAFDSNQFPELYCRTRDEIGFAYRPIVRVHFADAFGVCPGGGRF